MFRQLVHFPAFVLEHLCRQLLHLAWLEVKRSRVLIQVEVDGDLELFKDVMELEQIVVADELIRVNVAVPVHEDLKVDILPVFIVMVVDFDDAKVVLRIV